MGITRSVITELGILEEEILCTFHIAETGRIPLAGRYSENITHLAAPAMSLPHLEKLRLAHRTAAELILLNPFYAPIFERIERELRAAEQQDDVTLRARAALESYNAIG